MLIIGWGSAAWGQLTTTVVQDNFLDSSRTNSSPTATGGDLDIPYYLYGPSGGTGAVGFNATLGANALIASGSPTFPNFAGFVGTFYSNGTTNYSHAAASSITLDGVNVTSITLSFTAAFLTAPPSAAAAFRFGFYNSNGTPDASDLNANALNDQGYDSSVGTGTTSSTNTFQFAQESGGQGGPTNGSDVSTYAAGTIVTTTPANVADLLKHTYSLTLSRTSPTSAINFFTSIDGGVNGASSTSSAANPPYTTFNEIVFGTGSTAYSFALANIKVTETGIAAEPGTLAFSLIGLATGAGSILRRLKSKG